MGDAQTICEPYLSQRIADGRAPGLVNLPDDDRVQRGIMPLRARQVKVEQF